MDEAADAEGVLQGIFNDILQRSAEAGLPNDRIGIEIRHPSLETPILIPFRKREDLSGDQFLHEIERVHSF